jgi:hypothetical protein
VSLRGRGACGGRLRWRTASMKEGGFGARGARCRRRPLTRRGLGLTAVSACFTRDPWIGSG